MSPTVPPSYGRKKGIRNTVLKDVNSSGNVVSNLNDADIRLFARVINWDFGYPLDPVLDRVGDMRNDLEATVGIRRNSSTFYYGTCLHCFT